MTIFLRLTKISGDLIILNSNEIASVEGFSGEKFKSTIKLNSGYKLYVKETVDEISELLKLNQGK